MPFFCLISSFTLETSELGSTSRVAIGLVVVQSEMRTVIKGFEEIVWANILFLEELCGYEAKITPASMQTNSKSFIGFFGVTEN